MSSESTVATHERENRRYRRYVLELPVRLRRKRPAAEPTAVTRDVSCRGAYFKLERPLAVGSSLEFTLVLPGPPGQAQEVLVHCQGTVVRLERLRAEKRWGIGATIKFYEFVRNGKPQES